VTFLETAQKLVINKTKRVIFRKEGKEHDDNTKELVKFINSQKLLAMKTEQQDKFWLAKPVGQACGCRRQAEERWSSEGEQLVDYRQVV